METGAEKETLSRADDDFSIPIRLRTHRRIIPFHSFQVMSSDDWQVSLAWDEGFPSSSSSLEEAGGDCLEFPWKRLPRWGNTRRIRSIFFEGSQHNLRYALR